VADPFPLRAVVESRRLPHDRTAERPAGRVRRAQLQRRREPPHYEL